GGHWHNEATGKKETVISGEGLPVKRLRHVHATKAEARAAAMGKLDELTRADHSLSISMPGDPLVAAEGQIVALGFQIGVSGLRSITSARHQTSGSGFTTSIRTENQRAKHVRQEHNAKYHVPKCKKPWSGPFFCKKSN
ncbi:MAG: phage protein D, partial [Paracoccaceae bacterium]